MDMAISYSLAPNPKWYISDLTGKPLGGGSMYTYRSLNKTQFKFVYQDIAGQFPWTDPIIFDENGAQGPFYFQTDSAHPEDTYYLEVYDSQGVLQWTIDNFQSSGGGGSVVTIALDLNNLITNNVFWRNTGSSASPVGVTSLKLCPSAHAAFALTDSGFGPDTVFRKNNTNATDTITFPKFILGSGPLTGDVTPVNYVKYACTNTPAAETFKYVQFPITQGVQNLSNQNTTVTIWARGNSGTTTLLLQWCQFFGDGVGATAPIITPIQTITLTAAWTKFILQTTIPSVSGMVLGGCGNDGLFLQVQYPLGASCDIDFIKPSLYLGNVVPTEEYMTYDTIDSVINSQRTGYIMQGFETGRPPGYCIMADGSIGQDGSGATERANIDTFPLYNFLYTNVIDAWAPVSGGRSGSSVNDFTAGKTLTLTRVLGRVIGTAGNGAGLSGRQLGEFLGTESHLITLPDLPNPLGQVHGANIASGVNPPYGSVAGWSGGPAGGDDGVNITNVTSTGAPISIMQPTTFMSTFIKL